MHVNSISADRHFLFHGPPHGIRCKPLDEAARRFGAPPFRSQPHVRAMATVSMLVKSAFGRSRKSVSPFTM